MRIGLVVPHIFMQREILPYVIFSPAELALKLTSGLQALRAEVTLFTPGSVDTDATNITADLSYFERELAGRDDTYMDLLKKHPFTFVSLSRQVQSELIARAYQMANDDELDLVHIYTNEEDIALPFAKLCAKPVVFTHHDPFNFLIKYKSVFPKYKSLNWISMSLAQRQGMPPDTNWVANIYHGLTDDSLTPIKQPANDYVAYLGRIIEPKGVHLAIEAILRYNAKRPDAKLKLRIAGKHYAGHKKDTYWQERVLPYVDDKVITYDGFIDDSAKKREFLGNARAVIVPSLFDEPFGLVNIEALACGTPVVGLDSGAIPEIITDRTGKVAKKRFLDDGSLDGSATADNLATALSELDASRTDCRQVYEQNYTADKMCQAHYDLYARLLDNN